MPHDEVLSRPDTGHGVLPHAPIRGDPDTRVPHALPLHTLTIPPAQARAGISRADVGSRVRTACLVSTNSRLQLMLTFVFCSQDENVDVSQYRDQADVFYDSPIKYLTTRFPLRVDASLPPSPAPISFRGQFAVEWKHEWPKHLVLFGALLKDPQVAHLLLESLGYVQAWRSGNGLEEDPRRRGGVVVLRFKTP